MTIQHDMQSGEQLGELNAKLSQSFKRCRALLTDCREKLTPNDDEPDASQDEAEETGA